MEIKRLEMVIVFVSDVKDSIRWYQDTLGMSLLSHHGDFAILRAGESQIGLHGGANTGVDLRNAGTMPVFQVLDYQQARDALVSRGCEFIFEDRAGESQFGTFLDPDGNPLQIMQGA